MARPTTGGGNADSELGTGMEILARVGCIAVGTLYVLVGSVAIVALTGHLIEYADPYRIALLLKRLPGGVVLLWSMAVGAAAYAAWRVIQAWRQPYRADGGWTEELKRAAVALSGLAYGMVAYSAATIALRTPPGGRDAPERQQQHLVGRVLDWHGGSWLVGAAGVALVVVGVVQFWLAARRSYARDIRLRPHSRRAEIVVHVLAGYGYSARGVILCVLGYFLMKSALSRNPVAVGDTDTAFDFIGGGIVGNAAFAVVALGTAAYGLLMYANGWLYAADAEPGKPRRRATHRGARN